MKTTFDLEEKLVSEKKESIKKIESENGQETLILENVKNILNMDADEELKYLRRSGFANAINNAFIVEKELKSANLKINNLQNERVFTTEEIKKIALKYSLRFLPIPHYKGDLPSDIVYKMKEAEKKCRDNFNFQDDFSYSILAPRESFILQPEPIDPLLFIRIGEDLYYLAHKWGNDLSIFRNIDLINAYIIRLPSILLTIAVLFTDFIFWSPVVFGFSYALFTIVCEQFFDMTTTQKNWNKNIE